MIKRIKRPNRIHIVPEHIHTRDAIWCIKMCSITWACTATRTAVDTRIYASCCRYFFFFRLSARNNLKILLRVLFSVGANVHSFLQILSVCHKINVCGASSQTECHCHTHTHSLTFLRNDARTEQIMCGLTKIKSNVERLRRVRERQKSETERFQWTKEHRITVKLDEKDEK